MTVFNVVTPLRNLILTADAACSARLLGTGFRLDGLALRDHRDSSLRALDARLRRDLAILRYDGVVDNGVLPNRRIRHDDGVLDLCALADAHAGEDHGVFHLAEHHRSLADHRILDLGVRTDVVRRHRGVRSSTRR